MKRFLTLFLILATLHSNAQNDTTPNPLKITGYIETYYAYDFNNPANHTRPAFVYSFNRHNEVSLNLGFIKAAYQTEKVRGTLAVMTGSYANANLGAELGVLKNIFEANVGVKISKTKNIWVDAGVFASHIGFESAIGKDCYNVTRSILADNSPYFETGAKFTYTSNNQQLFLSALILNGWQRIQRVDGNNTPAFGHQLTYKPNTTLTLNSSSFIGNDVADSVRQMRYFHNFYTQYQPNNKFAFIVGFDVGAQQKSKGSSQFNSWYSPVFIAKFMPSKKINIAARAEYYSDKAGVIINTGTLNGFKTYGYSINLDYIFADNVMWRIEGKGYNSKDDIFTKNSMPKNQNYLITTALAISF